MKKIRVKAIKVHVVEYDVSYDAYADDYLPMNGKTEINPINSKEEFELLEYLFEDEHHTLRYDRIEVTEL